MDPFKSIDNVFAPARRAVAIAPHNTNPLADIPKAIYVGTGGDVTMQGVDARPGDGDQVWKNVPAGAILPFRAQYVRATGTSAADLLALY